jgi:hypothetical protein
MPMGVIFRSAFTAWIVVTTLVAHQIKHVRVFNVANHFFVCLGFEDRIMFSHSVHPKKLNF